MKFWTFLFAIVLTAGAFAFAETPPKNAAVDTKKDETKKIDNSNPDYPKPIGKDYFEVPCSFKDDYLIVEAKLNGKLGRFLFDTGFAAWVVVSNRIWLGEATGSSGFVSHTGVGQSQEYTIKKLEIGDMVYEKDIEVSGGDLVSGGDEPMDGLLGLSTFENYVCEISYQKNYIRFYPREKFDIFKLPVDNVNTHLIKFDPTSHVNSIYLPVSIGGVQGKAILDTGACGLFMVTYQHSAKQWGLLESDPKYIMMRGDASGAHEAYDVWAKDIEIGPIKIPCSYINVLGVSSTSTDSWGAIGSDFFQNYNLTIDFKGRHVYMEKFRDMDYCNRPADIGAHIYQIPYGPNKGKFMIIVNKKSPAEDAGLKDRSFVLSIDGKPLNFTNRHLTKKLLEGAPDSKVTLIVDQEGKVRKFEITRVQTINGAKPEITEVPADSTEPVTDETPVEEPAGDTPVENPVPQQ